MSASEENIDHIANQEQRLLSSRRTLEKLRRMGKVDEHEYREQLQTIDTQLHSLQDRLDDSIADMLLEEKKPPGLKTYVGQRMSDEDLAEVIQIGDVVRGHIAAYRVIDVIFSYYSVRCKARITNERGVWSFSPDAKKMEKGLFIRALERNEEAVDAFRHEIDRHPEAWEELVTQTHPGNFPRQIQEEYDKRATPSKKPAPSLGAVHASQYSVVIHSVKHGPLPEGAVHRNLGRDHRFITIRLDVDGELLDLSVNTDRESWQATSVELTGADRSMITQEMIRAIEKPENHIYLNSMIAETRKYRKLWIGTVRNHPQEFPKAVRKILA